MATTTKMKADPRTAFYASLGAGQLTYEKALELSDKAVKIAGTRRKDMLKTYQQLAKRGERVYHELRSSRYTRRAVDQTSDARERVEAAATTVRRGVDSGARATRSATKAS